MSSDRKGGNANFRRKDRIIRHQALLQTNRFKIATDITEYTTPKPNPTEHNNRRNVALPKPISSTHSKASLPGGGGGHTAEI